MGESQHRAARAQTPLPPSLDQETRSAVDTATAAYHLNRSPKTLRSWSSSGDGPIAPKRINGRLSWSVQSIRALMEEGGA